MVYFIAWTIKCSLHRRRKMCPFEMWKKGIILSSFNLTLSFSKPARYLNPIDFYRLDKKQIFFKISTQCRHFHLSQFLKIFGFIQQQ